MTEKDRSERMLRGGGVSRTYGMEKRYVICGGCGVKWNIAKEQDTRNGYLCRECEKGRKKHGKKNNGRTAEGGGGNGPAAGKNH